MNKINLSIPKPCHENWEEMSSVEKGKFCNSCQKNVFDFTKASDREIVIAFQQNKNLCGRFLDSQLNRDLIKPEKKNPVWMATTSTIISLIGLGTNESSAQATNAVKTEQTKNAVWLGKPAAPTINSNPIKIGEAAALPEIEISGIITDLSGPLPGAIVTVKGKKSVVQADIYGKYTVKAQRGDTLVFSFIGYIDFEYQVSKSNTDLKRTFSPQLHYEVMGLFEKKRTLFGRIFYRIGNLFR